MPGGPKVQASSLIGRVVGGKIRIDALLGSGAMGHVFRARHLTLAKDVALKVMRQPPEGASDAHSRRFAREARAASRLEHANSVSILDFGEDGADRLLYIVMELVQGEDVQAIIDREGRLSPGRACDIAVQALGAVAAAHDQGIIHRDLKPSNLIVTRRTDDDGREVDFVKVCDFGLAKFVTGAGESIDGTAASAAKVAGTPAYMSPEQAVGDELDTRTDLYSMGVILYEMFTGRLPFDGDTAMGVMLKHVSEAPAPPTRHAADLPSDVDRVVLWSLKKDRDLRAPTARELRQTLRQLALRLTGELASVPIPDAPPPLYDQRASRELLLDDEPTVSDDEPWEPRPEDTSSEETPISIPVPSFAADLVSDLSPPAPAASPPPRASTPPPADDELDIEALVNEAVESVAAEKAQADHAAQVPEHSLLAGLDSRRMSADLSDRAMYMWNRYGVSFEPYEGPHPFWIQDHRGEVLGPLDAQDALRVIRAEGAMGEGSHSHIRGADGEWMPIPSFVRLTGQEALLAPEIRPRPAGLALSGDLQQVNLASLFARLSRQAPTGRLAFTLLVHQREVAVEVHLAAGRPTFVYADEGSLQLPQLIVRQGIVQDPLLPLLFQRVIVEEASLEAIVSREASTDLRPYHPVFMRERLGFLFANPRGTFGLDTSVLPARMDAFAPSLVGLLPDLVYRSMPQGQLETEVASYLHVPLRRSETFNGGVRALGLSRPQTEAVRKVLEGPSAGASIPAGSKGARLYLSMLYVLVECGMLLPP